MAKETKAPDKTDDTQLPTGVSFDSITNMPKTFADLARKILAGWTITADAFISPPDASGFRIRLSTTGPSITFDGGVTIKNTGAPETDSGGMAIEHDGGNVAMEVAGPGVGSGAYAMLRNGDGSVAVGVEFDEILGTLIKMVGLPTSATGLPTGALWNSSGTLKIV